MEYELSKSGISIPYQTNRLLAELIDLINNFKPERLLILGDVKHGVPQTSFQERKEIPRFFKSLLKEVKEIDIIRGNHDGNLQNFLPDKVNLFSSKGVLIGKNFKIAAFHGHAWPHPQTLEADIMIVGHNHPTVLLPTPLGINISRRVWVRGALNSEHLSRIFLEQNGINVDDDPLELFEKKYGVRVKNSEMIIMPTFNDLLGGLPINSKSPKSLLGPLVGRGIISIEKFDVYLLDGNYLGKVDFLRNLLIEN
jgi:metallophosphoesterase superfamily enzyme